MHRNLLVDRKHKGTAQRNITARGHQYKCNIFLSKFQPEDGGNPEIFLHKKYFGNNGPLSNDFNDHKMKVLISEKARVQMVHFRRRDGGGEVRDPFLASS